MSGKKNEKAVLLTFSKDLSNTSTVFDVNKSCFYYIYSIQFFKNTIHNTYTVKIWI